MQNLNQAKYIARQVIPMRLTGVEVAVIRDLMMALVLNATAVRENIIYNINLPPLIRRQVFLSN